MDALNPLITLLIEKVEGKVIQTALNNLGYSLVVDGLIGKRTMSAIVQQDPNALSNLIAEQYYSNYTVPETTEKDIIMNYLAEAEGTYVHWNRTESDFTTPYGIYAKLFPRAKVVLYIRELARKYGVNLNRRNVKELKRLTNSFTRIERQTIRDYAWEFWQAKFIDRRVNKYLNSKEQLTFFSISVNGGMSRGYKALQSALGVKVDGKFGKNSIAALKNNSKNLNVGMIAYMKRFYSYLASKNPRRYGIYLNGWMNRLRRLA